METYTVVGMTCAHCVNAVRTEVGQIPGVTDVAVDLASGRIDVTASRVIGNEAVRAAVLEAGYELSETP